MSSSSGIFLSMGRETYKVPLDDLFGANRQKLVRELRKTGGAASSVVFLEGGKSSCRYDSDHEPLFRQESYFLYLSGVKEPDCSLAVQVATGETTLFIPKLPPDYATFMGRIKTLDEWKEEYKVDKVIYNDDIIPTLEYLLRQENGTKPKLLLMEGTNSDSGLTYTAPTHLQKHFDADATTLFPIIAECRVHKSPAEQSLIQHVTEITSYAHAYVMRNMHVDTASPMMEYQAESLFRHYCYYNYGCRLLGYTAICGCGPNASVLHYGHAAEPNTRAIRPTDFCLFDMGAEYIGGYGSDVTCSFPANGVFDEKQRHIYAAVLQAQVAVYELMKPSVSWVDCHKAAEAAILTALTKLSLVEPNDKTIEQLVELRLGAVFMPHGLGHFVGIDTHDVGGYMPGHPERSPLPGLKSLRTSRVLQKDMVLTVEPGCYFINHLLDNALSSETLSSHLNATKLNEYRGFGGVRLEDVVVVTESGCENWTLCPRTIEEVEAVMAGGKWPPLQDAAPELRRKRLTETTPLPSPASK